MPTRAEVDTYRRAQTSLVRAARADLRAFWASLDHSDLIAVRRALEAFWPSLIDAYGVGAAEVAAHWVEQLIGQAATLGPSMDTDRVNARMRWALGAAFDGNVDQSLANLSTILDELVQQHGRDTVDATCRSLGIRYARVPSGDTCAWCLILASRGATYASRSSAGGVGNRYHGDCDCVPTPMRDDDALPAGYDPDALGAMYSDARSDAGSGSIKKVAQQMRQQHTDVF